MLAANLWAAQGLSHQRSTPGNQGITMRHSSSRTSADRHGNGMSRSIMETVDDTKLMQEVEISLFKNEQQQGIERFVQYGFTAVPQKPSGGSGSTGSSGGAGGSGGRSGAEAMFSFLGGNRSHGIAMMVGDRRYRLYKLDNGEVALHDDQGHQIHIARDGIYASAPNSKKIVLQIMQSDQMPNSGSSGGQSKGGQTAQKKETAYATITLDKDSLTISHPTKINLTAPTIEHDGNVHLGGTASNTNDPVYGNHSGTGMTTNKVFVNATQPGPPTSLDTQT